MLDLAAQRIMVTGGTGFLGRHIVAALQSRGVPASSIFIPRKSQFDLTTLEGARRALALAGNPNPTTLIIHAAGLSGGLGANRRLPARFFYDNLSMGVNLIEAARQAGFSDRRGTFVQVGQMVCYPAAAPQPYREEDLFRSYPETEVGPLAVAKLALLQMLDAYRLQYGLRYAFLIPTSLYGPHDNLNPDFSHATGALIRRFVDAAETRQPEVICWGTGAPLRELLFVEDAAAGILRAAEVMGGDNPPAPCLQPLFAVNLSTGAPTSIRTLAETVAKAAGYTGRIVWDASKGDGTPSRCLDASRAGQLLGWSAATPLEQGIARTVAWYRSVRGALSPSSGA